jgi:hypothetical protein
MRRLLALAVLLVALTAAGCGGRSGPTIAQRCHAYAVRQTPAAFEKPMRPAFEKACNQRPKLLDAKH